MIQTEENIRKENARQELLNNRVNSRIKKANQFSAKKKMNDDLREQINYKRHLENYRNKASKMQEL